MRLVSHVFSHQLKHHLSSEKSVKNAFDHKSDERLIASVLTYTSKNEFVTFDVKTSKKEPLS